MMQLFDRTPSKNYFITLFVVCSVLFSAFSIIIYRHYENLQRINSWSFYNYEVARQSRLLLFNLLNMETGVRGYLLTGKAIFLEPYNKAVKKLPEQIKEIRQKTENVNTDKAFNARWLEQIEHFHSTLVAQMKLYDAGERGIFSEQILEMQRQQMDSLRDTLESDIHTRITYLNKEIIDLKQEEQKFTYILVLGTLLSISAMLIVTATIVALISRANSLNLQANEAEDRLKLVINGLNDGVYDFSPLNNTIYYSPPFKIMLGYDDEEFPNTLEAFNAVLHPDDAEATWETFRQYQIRNTDKYSNVFRLRHKNGEWIWILSRGMGFWNEDGTMIRCIGTHMDISEHKKREEDLFQANADLETFTYIASHDLRSPLVNLKGFANELQYALDKIKPIVNKANDHFTPEEQKTLSEALEEDIPEALKFIEKATDRMDTLTSAVLNLSRIGKRQYNLELVDTQRIFQKCIDAQGYEIKERDIEITCHPLPFLFTDPLAIEQIFSNLLDNAIKYLDPERKGKIIISSHQTTADVVYSVEDNGRGIDTGDKGRIFEMFRRARNAEGVRGSGMGMSFVRATVRKLGGVIWFNSILDSGTTFYVRLPKTQIKGKTDV